jgi:mannose-6-phosphate isomerase-like protein (cupin superfamily)
MCSDTPTAGPTGFRYRKPEFERGKQVVLLACTDRLLVNVQVLKEGGENNLHKHPHLDGLWMVLKGRVRFYGENDVLIGDYGPYEGVLIPRGSLYWFESSGDEDLELLQVEAFSRSIPNLKDVIADRVNVRPIKTAPESVTVHDARISVPS